MASTPSPHLLTGLKLQGATCSNNKLSLSNAISTVLPLTQLRWVKQTSAEKKASVVSVAGSSWLCLCRAGAPHVWEQPYHSPELSQKLVPELMNNSKSLCLSHR